MLIIGNRGSGIKEMQSGNFIKDFCKACKCLKTGDYRKSHWYLERWYDDYNSDKADIFDMDISNVILSDEQSLYVGEMVQAINSSYKAHKDQYGNTIESYWE